MLLFQKSVYSALYLTSSTSSVRLNQQGDQRWFKDQYLHREHDMPAVIYADGIKRWFRNGEFVRCEGPHK